MRSSDDKDPGLLCHLSIINLDRQKTITVHADVKSAKEDLSTLPATKFVNSAHLLNGFLSHDGSLFVGLCLRNKKTDIRYSEMWDG